MRASTIAGLVACGFAFRADAQQLLVERAGEWVSTISFPGPHGNTETVRKICRSHDRSFDPRSLGTMITHGQGTCTQQDTNIGAAGGSYAFTCTLHGMLIHATGEITRLGPDTVRSHVVSHTEGGPAGMKPDMDLTVTAHHTGPCQPGDATPPD